MDTIDLTWGLSVFVAIVIVVAVLVALLVHKQCDARYFGKVHNTKTKKNTQPVVSFVTKSSAAGGGSQQHHALSVQEPDSSSMRKEIDELRTEVQQLKSLLNQSMMSQPNVPRGQEGLAQNVNLCDSNYGVAFAPPPAYEHLPV